MNSRCATVVSAILNVILLYLVAWLLFRPSRTPSRPKWVPRSERLAPAGGTPAVADGAPNSSPSPRGRGFHWSLVESEDFKIYIRNLRSIGCPASVIHDLIVADVARLYRPRIDALLERTSAFEFWRPSLRENQLHRTLRQEYEGLMEDQRQLVRELLGPEMAEEGSGFDADVETLLERARFGFLPEPKQSRAREILAKYRLLERDLAEDQFGWNREEYRRRRQALWDARRSDLSAFLTGDELFELELRESPTATAVLKRTASFELSEEEYRALFAIQKEMETHRGTGASGEGLEGLSDETPPADLASELRGVLGEERYADYLRSQDTAWKILNRVGSDQDLDPDAVIQAYRLRKQMDQGLKRVLTEPDLSSEERAVLLEGLKDDYESDLRNILGEEAFEAFRKSGGIPAVVFSANQAAGGGRVTIVTRPGRLSETAEGPGGEIPETVTSPSESDQGRAIVIEPETRPEGSNP